MPRVLPAAHAWTPVSAVLSVVAALLCGEFASAAEPPATFDPAAAKSLRVGPALDAPFRSGLDERITVEAIDVPLTDFVKLVGELSRLTIRIDERALEESGIAFDEPITLLGTELRTETVLDRLCEGLELEWQIRYGSVQLSTWHREQEYLHVATYDVGRLLELGRPSALVEGVLRADRRYPGWAGAMGGGLGGRVVGSGAGFFQIPPEVSAPAESVPSVPSDPGTDVDPPASLDTAFRGGAVPQNEWLSGSTHRTGHWLSELIVRMTGAPESWEEQGGPGTILAIGDLLTIRQSRAAHAQIDRLLAVLLAMAEAPPAAGGGSLLVRPLEHDEDRRMRAKLGTPVTVSFIDTPLEEVALFLAEVAACDIRIDTDGLELEGLSTEESITYTAKDVPLRDVLGGILDPLNLTFIVEHESIVVTPVIVAEEVGNLQLALFDARWTAGVLGDLETVVAAVGKVTGPPESWDDQGGPASVVAVLDGLLLVRQSQEVVDEIEGLLTHLDRATVGRAPRGLPQPGDTRLLDYLLREHEPEQVAEFVRTFVDPASWEGEQGGAIRIVGRQMFVRTTLANHAAIHHWLSHLAPVREPVLESQPVEPKSTAATEGVVPAPPVVVEPEP